jgi:hypothetical protein
VDPMVHVNVTRVVGDVMFLKGIVWRGPKYSSNVKGNGEKGFISTFPTPNQIPLNWGFFNYINLHTMWTQSHDVVHKCLKHIACQPRHKYCY